MRKHQNSYNRIAEDAFRVTIPQPRAADQRYRILLPETFNITARTLTAGIIGAALGHLLSFPVYPITGPALLLSLLCLAGFQLDISNPVRDAALLFIGISIGTGVNNQAAEAVIKWPIAFAILAIMILCVLLSCRYLLIRFFNFTPRSATLAAAPGHLGFVISLGTSLNIDITPVAVVQAVRILALTMCVPFITMLFGIDIGSEIAPSGPTMSILHLACLIPVSITVALILKALKVPAAFIIGAMLVSSVTQISGLTPGTLSNVVLFPCLVVVGVLIGTRFSGISLQQLKSNLWAGLATTTATMVLACLAAAPVAMVLGMPIGHVIVAFSPGGLETMIAIGAVLGANAGFVAACHVGRLLLLTLLVPVVVSWSGNRK